MEQTNTIELTNNITNLESQVEDGSISDGDVFDLNKELKETLADKLKNKIRESIIRLQNFEQVVMPLIEAEKDLESIQLKGCSPVVDGISISNISLVHQILKYNSTLRDIFCSANFSIKCKCFKDTDADVPFHHDLTYGRVRNDDLLCANVTHNSIKFLMTMSPGPGKSQVLRRFRDLADRFLSPFVAGRLSDSSTVQVILQSPLEVFKDAITYRILPLHTSTHVYISGQVAHVVSPYYNHTVQNLLVASHLEPIYNYLDKDKILMTFRREITGKKKSDIYSPETEFTIIFDEMTSDSWLIYYCLLLDKSRKNKYFGQSNFKYISRSACYIERIKIEKLGGLSEDYTNVVNLVNFIKSCDTNFSNIERLKSGALNQLKVNDIVYTKNSVSYNGIKIEEDGLFEEFYSNVDLDPMVDIYDIIGLRIKHKVAKFEEAVKKYITQNTRLLHRYDTDVASKARRHEGEESDKRSAIVELKRGALANIIIRDTFIRCGKDINSLGDKTSRDELFSKYNSIAEFVPTILDTTDIVLGKNEMEIPKFSFTINGIPILVTVNFDNLHRLINGVRINTEEILPVISRALCLKSAEDYNIFLKSINKNSLLLHDVLANGLAVKIIDLPDAEYRRNPLPASCPRLSFIRDDKNKVYLKHNENSYVIPKFMEFVRAVIDLNDKTDNRLGRTRYGRRNNWEYCSARLGELIQRYTSIEKTTKDAQGDKIKNIESKLTLDEIKTITEVYKVVREQIIKKSMEFVELAAKTTKASLVEYGDGHAYKVQGKLQSYYVMNQGPFKVYTENGQYVCIVDKENSDVTPFDRLAARIYAVHNDQQMAEKINTLRKE